MNKRILELYKQAQEFAYKNISKEYWNTDNFHAVVSGKFAELIVRECVGVVENLSPGHEDYRNEWLASASVDQIEDAFRRDCVEQIKEHFGVKE